MSSESPHGALQIFNLFDRLFHCCLQKPSIDHTRWFIHLLSDNNLWWSVQFWPERLHILQHVLQVSQIWPPPPRAVPVVSRTLRVGVGGTWWEPGEPLCLRCPAEETSSRWTRRFWWSCRSRSPTSHCKRTPGRCPHPGTRPPDAASEDFSPAQKTFI